MNPLSDHPKARLYAYYVTFLVGLGLGALQIGFQAAEAGFPTWLKVALSVYAFLAAGLGLTAAQNMPSYQDVVEGDARPPRNQIGAMSPERALVIIALVLLVLILFFWLIPNR